ncbi:MAG: sugar isomerase [Acidimicrobiia bacterium]|nr:sugar isomerase [Acidimicrobiia bacterium]
MSHVEAELGSQPECWERAATLARMRPNDLPGPGARVAAVGCGTSAFMAQAYARLREAAGEGETDAFAASEMPKRPYDVVVAITRSGTTTEVVDLLAGLDTPRTIVLTADATTPAAHHARTVVALPFAAERSVVQTRFATSALALLRSSLGEDLGGCIRDGRVAVTRPLPVEPGRHSHLVFLGTGWAAGLAAEAALKCREAAGMWTEAHIGMEYRHGPISAAGPDTLVWPLTPLPPGLAGEIRATGATVLEPTLEPMAELVSVQRMAVALACERGLDPDRPRGLSFSVVLDSPPARQ